MNVRRRSSIAASFLNFGRRLTGSQETLNEVSSDEEGGRQSPSKLNVTASMQRRMSHMNQELLNMTLHQAARDGNAEAIELIMERTPEKARSRKLAEKDDSDLTALHHAARVYFYDGIKIFLKYKAAVDARDEDGLTPLHYLAKNKEKSKSSDYEKQLETDGSSREQEKESPSCLKLLVDSGASLWIKDLSGLTPLHHACIRGNTAVVKDILSYPDADLEICDNQGMTPLHQACLNGHYDIAEILIQKGANIRAKDKDYSTPFHLVATVGCINIAKLLVKNCNQSSPNQKVQIEVQVQIEVTVHDEDNEEQVHENLMDAVDLIQETDEGSNLPIHVAIEAGHLELVQYILQISDAAGISNMINRCRTGDTSCLHLAVQSNNLEVVQLLLEKGADIEAQDINLVTPLILACKQNSHEIVNVLLKKNAKTNVKDEEFMSPLLIASRYGHVESLNHLLLHNVDLSEVDNDEKTCLMWAAEENRTEAIEVLMTKEIVKKMIEERDKFSNTALHLASNKGNEESVQLLLEMCGAHADAKNSAERTTLHMAALQGHDVIISELITRDRSIVNTTDEESNTALHLAAMGGNVKCVNELVQLGANIELRNSKQWTPLDCAAANGFEKAATALLEAGASVQPAGKFKVCALHLACKKGHVAIVRILLQWKADVTFRSADGRNSLDYALDFTHKECVYALVKHHTWQESLKNAVYNPITGITDTPMRKLIRKMPELAEIILNKCLTDNGKRSIDDDFAVTANYEFLDDTYSCTSWLQKNDSKRTSLVDFAKKMDQTAIMVDEPSSSVYDENDIPLPTSEPYSASSDKVRKNHPLNIMAKTKCEQLLVHPLVTSLLNYKWKNCGRYVYYSNILIFMFFLVILNFYILEMPQFYRIDWIELTKHRIKMLNSGNRDKRSCVFYRGDLGNELHYKTGCQVIPHYMEVIKKILLIFSIVEVAIEVLIVVPKRKSLKFAKFLEISLYVFCILICLDFSDFVIDEDGMKQLTQNVTGFSSSVVKDLQQDTGLRQEWQQKVGAFAIFLSWIGLLLLMQKLPLLPNVGIYVTMFTDILWTFAQFLMVFIFFIIGFGLSFYVLLGNQSVFTTWYDAIITTFMMMIGELDYAGKFYPSSTGYSDQNYTKTSSYVLFLLFAVVMTIIIMNLLVGLAVGDIMEIQQGATIQRIGMQIDSTLDIEFFYPSFIRRRFIRRKETIDHRTSPIVSYFIRTFRLDANSFKPDILKSFDNKVVDDDDDAEEQDEQDVSEGDRIMSTLTFLRTRVNDVLDEQSELKQRVKKVDMLVNNTRTEAQLHSQEIQTNLNTTSTELNKSITYTQFCLRSTTEDQSNETRGRVYTTHQLVASLRVDIHATQEFLETAKGIILQHIQDSRDACLERMLFLDKIDTDILECNRNVGESCQKLEEEIGTSKTEIMDKLAVDFNSCEENINTTRSNLDDKLSNIYDNLNENLETNFKASNVNLDTSRELVQKNIEDTKQELDEKITLTTTECKENILNSQTELSKQMTETQQQITEDINEGFKTCRSDIKQTGEQLAEKTESAKSDLIEKFEEGFTLCNQQINSAEDQIEKKIQDTQEVLLKQTEAQKEECLNKIKENHDSNSENIMDTKKFLFDHVQSNINECNRNIETSAKTVQDRVDHSNESLTENINNGVATLAQKIDDTKEDLDKNINQAKETLLERTLTLDVLKVDLQTCDTKIDETKALLTNFTSDIVEQLEKQTGSVQQLESKLNQCDENIASALAAAEEQRGDVKYFKSIQEQNLKMVQEKFDVFNEKVETMCTRMETAMSTSSEMITQTYEGVKKFEVELKLCNLSIDRVEQNVHEQLDELKHFVTHLTKSVKYILEMQEEATLLKQSAPSSSWSEPK